MKQTVLVKYQGGTAKNPQQTKITQASFINTDHVHFPDGRLSTIPPYSAVSTATELLGGCRAIHGVEFTSSGFYYLYGTNTRLMVLHNGILTNITPLLTSSTAAANSIATTNSGTSTQKKTITITSAAHGQAVGDRVKISGATATGGIAAGSINKEHIITAVTTDTFSVLTDTEATSTVSGGGGAATVYYKQIAAGSLDQFFPSGIGCGLIGAGLIGSALASASGIYSYPRIWSFDNFGSDVVMTPGGSSKIYIWGGSIDTAPTVLTNAPTDCDYLQVINNAIVALCGRRIDICDIGDGTTWTPATSNTAYSVTVQRVNRLTGIIGYGEKSALIYTENEVFYLRFVGEPDYWDLSSVLQTDGIISPNACVELNAVIYWKGRNNFYRFAGSYPEVIENSQNADFIDGDINTGQQTKSFMSADFVNNQVYFHYPATSSNEPDKYVIYHQKDGHFTLGNMNRTAAMTRFVGGNFYYANSTSASSAGTIYNHYRTDSSLPVTWYAETSEGFAGEGDTRFEVMELMPDSYQYGNISVKFYTREWPQDATEYESSTYTITPTTTYQTVVATGRLRRIRFSGATQMTLGGWKETIRTLGKQ